MNVWVYWEGPAPLHLAACYERLRRVCTDSMVHFVNNENLRYYLPNIRDDLDAISNWKGGVVDKSHTVVAKCDYIRTRLVYEYGGFYVDSDYVALKDFSAIAPEDGKLVGYRLNKYNTNLFCGNCFGAEKGNEVLGLWKDAQEQRLRESMTVEWATLANLISTPIMDANDDKITIVPEDMISPVPWQQPERFYSAKTLADLNAEDSVGIMLFGDVLKTPLPEDSLLNRLLYTEQGLVHP